MSLKRLKLNEFKVNLKNKFYHWFIQYPKSKYSVWRSNERIVALFEQFNEILVDGAVILVIMIPFAYFTGFWKLINPLLILSYGLTVYFIFVFRKHWKSL